MNIIDEAKRIERNRKARKRYWRNKIRLDAEINKIMLEACLYDHGYNRVDIEMAVPETLRFLRTGEMNDRRRKDK